MIIIINKLFHTKRIVVAFLVSAFVFLSPVLYALDNNDLGECEADKVQIESSASLNDIFMKVVDYGKEPVGGAVSGGLLCGWPCFIIGGVIGGVDRLLNHYGVTDESYLTFALIGLNLGNKLETSEFVVYEDLSGLDLSNFMKSFKFSLLGFAAGLIFPTGNSDKFSGAIAPGVSFAVGSTWSEKSAGTLDELIIKKGYTDNHYLTFIVISKSLVGSFVKNPAVVYLMAVPLGVLTSHFGEEKLIERLFGPLKTIQDSNAICKKYGVDPRLNDQVLVNIIVKLLAVFFTQKFMSQYTVMMNGFEGLNNHEGRGWEILKQGAIQGAIVLPVYAASNIALEFVNKFFDRDVKFDLDSKMKKSALSEKNLSRLKDDKEMRKSFGNSYASINNAFLYRGMLVKDFTSSLIDGADGIKAVAGGSPVMIIWTCSYNVAKSFLGGLLKSQEAKFTDESNLLNLDSIALFEHVDGSVLENVAKDIDRINYELKNSEFMQDSYASTNFFVMWVDETIKYIVARSFIGYGIKEGSFSFEDRSRLVIAATQLSNLLDWLSKGAEGAASCAPSLSRISNMTDWLKKGENATDVLSP